MRILRFKPCPIHSDNPDCWCGAQYEYLTKQGEPIKIKTFSDRYLTAFVLRDGWWRGWESCWLEPKRIVSQQT